MDEHKSVDPLTLAIVEGRLYALNEELGTRLFHQCFSVPTSHVRDLGSVLFDKDERILCIGTFMPGHTAGSHICVKGMLDAIGRENIHPDDFIIANDPFIVRFGHIADWSFLRPMFYEGELVFYHFVRTHQYDNGGAFPGCYFPRTYDCHGEGLMLPPVKIIERGKIDEKVYSVILNNVRGSAMVRADNMLVFGSMRQIEGRLFEMFKEYGKDTVIAACDEIIWKAEKTIRKIISKWPAGTYEAERASDGDGTTDKPVWVRLALTVKPDEGQLIFDFSDSDKQVDFVNVPLGQVWSSVVAGLLWSLPRGTPSNQGLFNCMDIITKEGTVLSPVYPATTGGQTVALGQEIIECVQLALSQIVPKDTAAIWGRHVNPLYVGKRRDRIDPRTGSIQEYTAHTFHATPSSGAIWDYDGVDGSGSSCAAGALQRAPIEVVEWEIPYRWLHYEFLMDSAGAGRWRGGLGTHVESMNVYNREVWQPLDCMTMTGNADGEKFGAPGLLGGMEGTKTKLGILRNGEQIEYHTFDRKYLEPGDIFIMKSGGGGGIGDPLDREVEKVRWDALNRYISLEAARDLYGVVIDPKTFEVDHEATKALREKLKVEKKKIKKDS